MSVELNIFIRTKTEQEIVIKSCLGGSAMYSIINEALGTYDTPQQLTDGKITSAMVECDKQIAKKRRLLSAIKSTSELDEILDCAEDIEQLEVCSQELSFLRSIIDHLSVDPDVGGLFFSYD